MNAVRTHSRLLDVCSTCAEAWAELGSLDAALRQRLQALDNGQRQDAGDELGVLPAAPCDVERQEALVAELRRRHTRALEEKSELLRTPPHRRAAKIRHARRRFRSVLLAEMLLAESIRRSAQDPEEAASLAHLVARVLAGFEEPAAGFPAPRRVVVLRARAAAHVANATRVGGDLSEADRLYAELRQDDSFATLPTAVQAEIDRLEASLRYDQRRFPEAEALLGRAAEVYREVGDRDALARTYIKRGIVRGSQGRAEEMMDWLEAAAAALDTTDDSWLHLCIVNARINGLCDLGRYGEADRLLADNLHRYTANEEAHLNAIYRGLEGRVALGLGDARAAEDAFAASQQRFEDLGRLYDAAHMALLRAHAMLANGETTRVRRLAAELVMQFERRGVVSEAVKALDIIRGSETSATLPLPHSI